MSSLALAKTMGCGSFRCPNIFLFFFSLKSWIGISGRGKKCTWVYSELIFLHEDTVYCTLHDWFDFRVQLIYWTLPHFRFLAKSQKVFAGNLEFGSALLILFSYLLLGSILLFILIEIIITVSYIVLNVCLVSSVQQWGWK